MQQQHTEEGIVRRMIEHLQQGSAPWLAPWTSSAPPTPAPDRHQRIEAILANSGAKIIHVPGSRPHYHLGTDQIVLPPREQFPSADAYYTAALHALIEWSGHPARLARDLQHPIGSTPHTRETLRRDLAALMLSQRLGLTTTEDNIPHARGAKTRAWLRLLDKDPQELVRAITDAEKAANVVIQFEHAPPPTRPQDWWQQARDLPGHRSHDQPLREQMRSAKRQALQHAEDLLTLARVREQQVQSGTSAHMDDAATARERHTAAEVVTLASERLLEVRTEARDALISEPRSPRPVAVAVATTTQSNEHLRERVKRERQEVHHAASAGDKADHERSWWELSEPERQRIIEALREGRSVTLPRDAPSELRMPVIEPNPFPLLRPASRVHVRVRDADF